MTSKFCTECGMRLHYSENKYMTCVFCGGRHFFPDPEQPSRYEYGQWKFCGRTPETKKQVTCP
jgi:hypothetical protein